MNEELEKELDNWFEEYKKEEKEILENHRNKNEFLNNRSLINQLQKKYWEKKKEILKKYDTQ